MWQHYNKLQHYKKLTKIQKIYGYCRFFLKKKIQSFRKGQRK